MCNADSINDTGFITQQDPNRASITVPAVTMKMIEDDRIDTEMHVHGKTPGWRVAQHKTLHKALMSRSNLGLHFASLPPHCSVLGCRCAHVVNPGLMV